MAVTQLQNGKGAKLTNYGTFLWLLKTKRFAKRHKLSS